MKTKPSDGSSFEWNKTTTSTTIKSTISSSATPSRLYLYCIGRGRQLRLTYVILIVLSFIQQISSYSIYTRRDGVDGGSSIIQQKRSGSTGSASQTVKGKETPPPVSSSHWTSSNLLYASFMEPFIGGVQQQRQNSFFGLPQISSKISNMASSVHEASSSRQLNQPNGLESNYFFGAQPNKPLLEEFDGFLRRFSLGSLLGDHEDNSDGSTNPPQQSTAYLSNSPAQQKQQQSTSHLLPLMTSTMRTVVQNVGNSNDIGKHDKSCNADQCDNLLVLASDGDWTAYFDEGQTDLIYYYNARTQTSQWDKPYSTFPNVDTSKLRLSKPSMYLEQSQNQRHAEAIDTKEYTWFGSLFRLIFPMEESYTKQKVNVDVKQSKQNHSNNNHITIALATQGPWSAYYDDTSDTVFYFNAITGVSQWEVPTSTFPKVNVVFARQKASEQISPMDSIVEEAKKVLDNVSNWFRNHALISLSPSLPLLNWQVPSGTSDDTRKEHNCDYFGLHGKKDEADNSNNDIDRAFFWNNMIEEKKKEFDSWWTSSFSSLLSPLTTSLTYHGDNNHNSEELYYSSSEVESSHNKERKNHWSFQSLPFMQWDGNGVSETKSKYAPISYQPVTGSTNIASSDKRTSSSTRVSSTSSSLSSSPSKIDLLSEERYFNGNSLSNAFILNGIPTFEMKRLQTFSLTALERSKSTKIMMSRKNSVSTSHSFSSISTSKRNDRTSKQQQQQQRRKGFTLFAVSSSLDQ